MSDSQNSQDYTERTREEVLEDLAAKMRRRAPVGGSVAAGNQTNNQANNQTTKATKEKSQQQTKQTKHTKHTKHTSQPQSQPQTKICAHCGKEFTTTNSRKIYCSTKCNELAQREKKKNRPPDPDAPLRPKDKLVRVRCKNPNCPNGGHFETTEELYKKMKAYCDENCRKEAHRLKYYPPKPKPEKPVSFNEYQDEVAKENELQKSQQEQYQQKNIQSQATSQQEKKEKTTQVVEIDYVPHPAQMQFHNSKARFRVLVCGIRFGKDRACIQEFIKLFAEMLSEDRPTSLTPRVHGWLVAPSFPLARQLWREIKYFFPRQWITNKNEAELRIETIGNGLIEIKSASDPDSLVSTGIDICILSEFSRVHKKEEVWGYIRGRVSSPYRGPGGKGGIVLINGTPKARDFYYEMYCWGQSSDPDYADWESWQFPSSANPHMNLKDIEAARKTLPERIFRSEYLAEFIADGGDVFLNVDEVSTGIIEEPEPGMAYFAAWDPAEKGDFSSFGIRNSTGQEVYLKRFTGVPYTMQMDAVEYLCKKYNFAPLEIDCTAAGATTLVQSMRLRGVNALEIFFTNALKAQWVAHLAVLFENKEIELLSPKVSDDAKAQMEELKAYTYTYTSTGKISYHHLPGQHDDCVDMLLLLYKDFNSSIMDLPYMGLLLGGNRWKTA